MATLTFTSSIPLPGAMTPAQAVAILATQWEYKETVPNPAYDPNTPGSQEMISNPQTKAQFCQAKVDKHLLDTLKAGKRALAEKQAGLASDAEFGS